MLDGRIFKEITGKDVPECPIEIWEEIKKSRPVRKFGEKHYGFKFKEYDIDIDKLLSEL